VSHPLTSPCRLHGISNDKIEDSKDEYLAIAVPAFDKIADKTRPGSLDNCICCSHGALSPYALLDCHPRSHSARSCNAAQLRAAAQRVIIGRCKK
jgi:hypothetical protein